MLAIHQSRAASTFRSAIRAAVRAFWKGIWDYNVFFDQMLSALGWAIPRAWYEGAAVCGVQPADLTDEERLEMRNRMYELTSYIDGFARAIEEHSQANGGKLGPLMARADVWVNRYNEVKTRAEVMACANQPMMWVLGLTRSHCSDCWAYAGRVYRARVWERYGALPQSSALACRGFNCKCRLEPVDWKCWPGRPPSPTYG